MRKLRKPLETVRAATRDEPATLKAVIASRDPEDGLGLHNDDLAVSPLVCPAGPSIGAVICEVKPYGRFLPGVAETIRGG